VTRVRRLGPAALAVVALSGVLAGCGANDNGGVITPPKGGTTTVATTAPPSSASP
jgi:hypothetical protein